MEKIPTSIDQGIERMLTESRARGLLHLTTIYGRIFTREELQSALDLHDLNVDSAALYLQDRLPSEPQHISKPVEKPEEQVELQQSSNNMLQNFTTNQIPGPLTGKIALEFSLSSQYVDSAVPVFYISDEILKEIFSFLGAGERAKLASICKTWMFIDLNTGYLYKRDCLKLWEKTHRPEINVFIYPFYDTKALWGSEYPKAYHDAPEYLKSFKTWRNMWVKRSKIRFNGVYISRVAYFKQGQVNLDNLPSYHKIVFFRYLRFYNDFSVCCLNTTKKPREFLKLVEKSNEEARIGEWARAGDKLLIHLAAKNEVFTYDLEVKSSQPDFFDLLKLVRVRTRSPGEIEYTNLGINNEAWPKYFKFINLKI